MHRVYEGNFSKIKIDYFFFLFFWKVASAVYEGNFKKINFFSIFLIFPSIIFSRLQRPAQTPCAQGLWEQLLKRKSILFYFISTSPPPPACSSESRPCAWTHRVYEGNFGPLCVNAQDLHWQLSFHGWGHEEAGYIRMLYYEHVAGNSVRRFEVWS